MVASKVKVLLQVLADNKINQVKAWQDITSNQISNYDELIESIRNYNNVGEIDVFISKEENLDILKSLKENIVDMCRQSANITNSINKYSQATCKGLDIICVPTKPCDANLGECFRDCVQLLIVNSLDTSNVTNMSSMFHGCSSLTALDVSGFETDNVTNMSSMFYNCSSLTALDVSGFVTDNVPNMGYMFYNCGRLTALDVSGFMTDNVTNMEYMFNGCSSLTALDVSGFVTDNVTNMRYMFNGCSSLTALGNGTISFKSATNITNMFRECYALETISVSDIYISGIYLGSCSKLSDTSVVSWITALYDWSNNPEGLEHSYDFTDTLPTMTFHKTTGTKIETLTTIYNVDGVDEELTLLEIALLKGWQINY